MDPFLDPAELRLAEAVAGIADTNPFLPARIDLERRALGAGFVETGEVWRVEGDLDGINPNLSRLSDLVEAFVPRLRARLRAGVRPAARELLLYEAVVRYLLYARYEADWLELVHAGERGEPTTAPVGCYARFVSDVKEFLALPDLEFPFPTDAPSLFAWGYQIRRAFHHTFRRIYGGSMPAARLRAAVWQSIFTHDNGRYRRTLYSRMADIPTLIVGESGTGKELVARAIALSRYIPFDSRSRSFAVDFSSVFRPLNIAALSPTLVESELFGHQRGSFTGALSDREGWLESSGDRGTVFLDEIGELDTAIQIKLLRVLESRVFQRIGETRERRFQGKIVAATHRDLEGEMRSGRFRPDFYYRLCADVIHTPSLREQIRDSPGDLLNLVRVLAQRLVGPEEVSGFATEVVEWVARELGSDYPWPGNVRELEQCARNLLIRGEYQPARSEAGGPEAELLAALRAGTLSAEELLRGYCTLVYAREGSYEAAGRVLGLDRRTVKSRVDREWLARSTERRSEPSS